jgi:hypothetical protein
MAGAAATSPLVLAELALSPIVPLRSVLVVVTRGSSLLSATERRLRRPQPQTRSPQLCSSVDRSSSRPPAVQRAALLPAAGRRHTGTAAQRCSALQRSAQQAAACSSSVLACSGLGLTVATAAGWALLCSPAGCGLPLLPAPLSAAGCPMLVCSLPRSVAASQHARLLLLAAHSCSAARSTGFRVFEILNY